MYRSNMLFEFRFESKAVAIKVIQPNRTSDVSLEHKEEFQREVTLLSRVQHENIVKVPTLFASIYITCISFFRFFFFRSWLDFNGL